MIIDPVYEKFISPLIESQFPAEIREVMGPVFVAFVVKYFEWLESQDQAQYHTRRLMSYKDIDTTTADFLIHFKEKYLKNIQLETTSNVKLLIKHSLDIYRSRGTTRAIDLLFRLVFGVGAEVYTPGNDIMRLSDGKWSRPTYLEVSLREDNEKFVGKEIVGLRSQARAFVERSIRRQSPSQLNDILYISALVGNFQTGELINTVNAPFNVKDCPSIVGSMTKLTVLDGAANFKIGDLVNINSIHGNQGIGRVTSVSNTTGIISFALEEGGFGYSANAQILVSNKVLGLGNVVVDSNLNNTHGYFELFETVYQPLANISFINSNGNFTNNDTISTYYANNLLKGSGVALSATMTNSSAGYMMVAIRTGNLNSNAIYNAANAVAANLAVTGGYTDLTATGNVISESSNVILTVDTVSGQFLAGEEVFQIRGANTINATVSNLNIILSNGTISLTNHIGYMLPNTTIIGRTSNATANIRSIEMSVGVISVNNTFSLDPRALITNTYSNSTAYVLRSSLGTGASVGVGSLDLTQVVNLNTDFIYSQLGINLDSVYLFASLASANLNSNISACLLMNSFTIGRIATLGAMTGGQGYTVKPYVRAYQQYVYPLRRRGWQMDTANLSGSFQLGEELTQLDTGARGIFRQSIGNTFYVDRASLFQDFAVTNGAGTMLVGAASGATANIVYLEVETQPRPLDLEEEYTAINAEIASNTQISTGSVTTMDVYDSGFGFLSNETATFVSQDGTKAGTLQVILGLQGQNQGFYKKTGGHLSSDKKLFDGDYYQDFSYEVRSSVTLNKYQEMLKKILHVAGTKAFGAFYYRNVANAALQAQSQPITQGA